MKLDWIRAGVREEHLLSLFKEDTWKQLFEEFPEIKEISFIGEKGTGKASSPISNSSKEERVEIYAMLEDSFPAKKKKMSMKLLRKLYQYLSAQLVAPGVLEVKLVTKYIGVYSGYVLRDESAKPNRFNHRQGIQGFHERIRFDRRYE